MALDAATLALTAAELKATLTDAKIAKIFEPTRDELVITLRTRTDTYALLLSARSGSARVCLTEETFENPETPPSFCMLMRKHLTGGRLLDVHMEPGDRIVYFDFQCTNEMGDLVRNTLCAELMGRYSNLVLVQSGKIIDALKRVDFEDSDVRQLLPGLPYTTPPKPARPDFLLVSSASIVAAACQRELPVADALNKTVAGVGPVVCREAAWRAFDGEHLPANELTDAQKRSLMAAIDELKELVRPDTKLICINNASNPLGAVLDRETLEQIVEIAQSVGAYVLSDEVYLPLENTENFWSMADLYDRAVVTNSISKTYSVPGARIGWTVSNRELADKFRVYRDYTMICCGEFNDALATYILQNREAVLERNREIVFRNMAIAQEWIDSEPRVTWQAPKGVSVAYIQWDIPMDDEEFCIKLLKEEGVLLVPGNRFELPGGARLGYCAPEPVLREGLARLGRALRQFD